MTPVSAEDKSLGIELIETNISSPGAAGTEFAAAQDIAEVFRPYANTGLCLLIHDDLRFMWWSGRLLV